ncbi:MAG: rhodanese-like domain-containing protein [Haloferula sp.]
MNITVEQLSAEIGDGHLTLVDVRTPAEFRAMHISDSELMPLGALRAAELKEKDCVLVCQSGKRAELAFAELTGSGSKRLRVLEGGVAAWERAGHPVVRGGAAWSLERQTRLVIGIMVLTGVLLGWLVHPGFYGISAFAGAGLIFAGITDWCGMALLIAKAPWNQRGGDDAQGKSCSL